MEKLKEVLVRFIKDSSHISRYTLPIDNDNPPAKVTQSEVINEINDSHSIEELNKVVMDVNLYHLIDGVPIRFKAFDDLTEELLYLTHSIGVYDTDEKVKRAICGPTYIKVNVSD